MRKVSVGICGLFVALFAGHVLAQENLQSMTIQLDWFPNANAAGILLAKERGWYAERGIDLTIKSWQKGISTPDEVVAGRAQIGVATGGLVIKARANGAHVKAITAQYQKSPLCFVSKKHRGIATPKDLAGKKVGISTPKTELMIKVVLANKGLDYDEIVPVMTGGDLGLLINDDVDVFTGFMNDEPLSLQEQGYEVTYIPAFKYGYDFYDKVYFVTEVLIQEQPELVQDFLDVTLQGWKAVYKDPVSTAQFIVDRYHPNRSVKQQTGALKMAQTLATLGVGENLIGFMEERIWAKGIELLYEYQQIEKKISARELFTLEFLKK